MRNPGGDEKPAGAGPRVVQPAPAGAGAEAPAPRPAMRNRIFGGRQN